MQLPTGVIVHTRWLRISIPSVLIALGACGADDADSGDGGASLIGEAGEFDLDLVVDGIDRTAHLHAPGRAIDAMASGPVPLLFALHSGGQTGEGFIESSHLGELANENAALLVGPDAINSGWVLESSEDWTSPDGYSTSLQNDLALMLALVDQLGESYDIDPDRIFTAGFSRGAAMSAALATASAQIEISSGTYKSPFAAHAVSAGYDVFDGHVSYSAAAPKHPIWIVHGTDDAGVPYEEGQALAQALDEAGWDVTFTTVQGAPNAWLYQAGYGQSNQDLWDWFTVVSGG